MLHVWKIRGLHLGLAGKYSDRYIHDTAHCFVVNICVLTFKYITYLVWFRKQSVMSCQLQSHCEASFYLSLHFCFLARKWGLKAGRRGQMLFKYLHICLEEVISSLRPFLKLILARRYALHLKTGNRCAANVAMPLANDGTQGFISGNCT